MAAGIDHFRGEGAGSDAAPEVSVSIVTWNSAHEIARCLGSVAGRRGGRAVEVIVVDNASSDGTPAIVTQHYPQAQLHVNPANAGFASAQAQAWPLTRGRYWLLLNPDVVLNADCIDRLVDFMDCHPRAAAVTARLADAEGRPQHCVQRTPSIFFTLLEASRLHLLLPRRWRGRAYLGPYWTYEQTLKVGWAWGTVLMARRAAVEAVGALDPAFPMYGEDLEWCLRVRRAGWEIWFDADAHAVHAGEASTRQRWQDAERQRRIVRAIDAALMRHHGAAWLVAYRAACCLALAAELCVRSLRRQPREQTRRALEYCWEVLRGRGSVDRHSDA